MSAIYFMLPLALLLGILGVVAFLAAARRGQFDDLETPAIRVLFDEEPISGGRQPRPGRELPEG